MRLALASLLDNMQALIRDWASLPSRGGPTPSMLAASGWAAPRAGLPLWDERLPAWVRCPAEVGAAPLGGGVTYPPRVAPCFRSGVREPVVNRQPKNGGRRTSQQLSSWVSVAP